MTSALLREHPHIARLFATYGPRHRAARIFMRAAQTISTTGPRRLRSYDFDVNATATIHMLEMTRQHSPEAVFIFVITNKVYGDTPNRLPLIEQRHVRTHAGHRYAANGVDEKHVSSILRCTVYSVAQQSFRGRHGAGIRTLFRHAHGIFRCGCITGGDHAAGASNTDSWPI